MAYTSFFDRFPDYVNTELRNIDILNDQIYKPIPVGNYGFIELYCDEIDCDCRNVVIHIVSLTPNKLWAILRYGWEKKPFYVDWAYGDRENPFAQNMPGIFIDPLINVGLHQSSLVNAF